MAQRPLFNTAVSAGLGAGVLIGGKIFVGQVIFFPGTLAAAIATVVVWRVLRSEHVYQRVGVTTSLMFLGTWVVVGHIGLYSGDFLAGEKFAFLLFGIIGIMYASIQSALRKVIDFFGNLAIARFLHGVGSSVLAILVIGKQALKFKQIVSVRSIAAIGVIPGILLNIWLRTIEFGVVSDLLVQVSSIGTIGFILAVAFTADALGHTISGLRSVDFSLNSESDNEANHKTPNGRLLEHDRTTPGKDVNDPGWFRSIPNSHFIHIVTVLAASAHDELHWSLEGDDGSTWVYAQSGNVDEFIIGRRAKTLSSEPDEFKSQISQEIENMVSSLGSQPQQISLVTDAELADDFYLHLQKEGLSVIDAVDLSRIQSQS